MKPEHVILFALSRALSQNKIMMQMLLEIASEAKPLEAGTPAEFYEYLKKKIDSDIDEDLTDRFPRYLEMYNNVVRHPQLGDENKSLELRDLTIEEFQKLLSDRNPPQSLS